MNETIILGLWIIVAYICALYIDRLGVPRISTYLLAGILISPPILGHQLNLDFVTHTEELTQFFLAIIAFLVGVELDIKEVSRHRSSIILGTLGQIIGAIVLTSLVLYLIFPSTPYLIPMVLITGAIAATTAPAATISVIEEYRAHGPLTNALLGIVILDDIIGVVIFSTILNFFLSTDGNGFIINTLSNLSLSIVIGFILGAFIGFFNRKVKSSELRFPLFFGVIILAHNLALTIHNSSILCLMMLGLFPKVFSKEGTEHLLRPIKNIEEFVFIVFFILAGTHFDLNIFSHNLLPIVFYVLARGLGKYFGALIGISGDSGYRPIRHLIGLGLLPQAGLAVGLALSLTQFKEFAPFSSQVINIIIGGTMIYELIGPLLTKYALTKASEIPRSLF